MDDGTADKPTSELRVVPSIENQVPAISDPVVLNDAVAAGLSVTGSVTMDEEQHDRADQEEEVGAQGHSTVAEIAATTALGDAVKLRDEKDPLVEKAGKKAYSDLTPSEARSVVEEVEIEHKTVDISDNHEAIVGLSSSEKKTSEPVGLDKSPEKIVSLSADDETKSPIDLCTSGQSEPATLSNSSMAMENIGPSQSNEKQDLKPPPKGQFLGTQEGKIHGQKCPSTPQKLSKPQLNEPPSELLVPDTPNTVVSAITTASSATNNISVRTTGSLRSNGDGLVAAKLAIANGRSHRVSSDSAAVPASRGTSSRSISSSDEANLRSTTASFVRAKQAIASGRSQAPLEEDCSVAGTTTTTGQIETAEPIGAALQPGAVSVQPVMDEKIEESTDGKDMTHTDGEESKESPVLLEAMLVPPSTELEIEEAVERAPVHSAMIIEQAGQRIATCWIVVGVVAMIMIIAIAVALTTVFVTRGLSNANDEVPRLPFDGAIPLVPEPIPQPAHFGTYTDSETLYPWPTTSPQPTNDGTYLASDLGSEVPTPRPTTTEEESKTQNINQVPAPPTLLSVADSTSSPTTGSIPDVSGRPIPIPTQQPSKRPSPSPVRAVTSPPTFSPTGQPTKPAITLSPTKTPTTVGPTRRPTPPPTNSPTTTSPTRRPTPPPTRRPTHRPTPRPTPDPTARETADLPEWAAFLAPYDRITQHVVFGESLTQEGDCTTDTLAVSVSCEGGVIAWDSSFGLLDCDQTSESTIICYESSPAFEIPFVCGTLERDYRFGDTVAVATFEPTTISCLSENATPLVYLSLFRVCDNNQVLKPTRRCGGSEQITEFKPALRICYQSPVLDCSVDGEDCLGEVTMFDSDDTETDDECVAESYSPIDYDEALWNIQEYLNDNVIVNW